MTDFSSYSLQDFKLNNERERVEKEIMAISRPSQRNDMSLMSINSSINASSGEGDANENAETGTAAPARSLKMQAASATRLFQGSAASVLPDAFGMSMKKKSTNAAPQAGSLPLNKGLVQVNHILDWGPERLKMRSTMKTM